MLVTVKFLLLVVLSVKKRNILKLLRYEFYQNIDLILRIYIIKSISQGKVIDQKAIGLYYPFLKVKNPSKLLILICLEDRMGSPVKDEPNSK